MLCVIVGRALVRVIVEFPSPLRSTMMVLVGVSASAAAIASRRVQAVLPPALLAGQFPGVAVASSVAVPTVKVSVAAAALVAGSRRSGAIHTRLATRRGRR